MKNWHPLELRSPATRAPSVHALHGMLIAPIAGVRFNPAPQTPPIFYTRRSKEAGVKLYKHKAGWT